MFCHIINTIYKRKDMIKMERLHCVYVERLDGDKNVIETEILSIAGVRAGIIRQTVKKKRKGNIEDKGDAECNGDRKSDRRDKELVRVIRKLCDKETIIVANERIVQRFGLPNTLFEMKKKELLDNKTIIAEHLKAQIGEGKRKTFLLSIQSKNWSQREIEEILCIVKNYYENIYIHVREEILDIECLKRFFYDGYGVMLQCVDDSQMRKVKIDTVLFLVKYWNKECIAPCYRNGYVVTEFDNSQRTRRKRLGKIVVEQDNIVAPREELYMGLVYSDYGKQIPYELAVVIKNHVYLQHLVKLNNPQNEISVVAIYGAEWYN